MDLRLANHSSYPRADEHTGGESSAREAGAGLADDALIAAAIRDQEAAGLDVVTDGQVRWTDPISFVLREVDGVRLGGWVRDGATGVSYRQPLIVGALRRRRPLLCADLTAALRVARGVVKAVLPGPYTLARMAKIEAGPYGGVPALAQALSDLLAEEVADLAAAGARLIQIEEPAILARPADIRLLRQVIEPLWEARGNAQLVFATYGSGAEPLYAQLESVCADLLAFDIVSSPALCDVIAATGSGKELVLGVVAGGSPSLEAAAAVARQVERMLKRYTFEVVYVQPSCGLRDLPRTMARAKLDVLREVGALVRAGGEGRVQG